MASIVAPTESFKEADKSVYKLRQLRSVQLQQTPLKYLNGFLIWDTTDVEKELKLNLDCETASVIVRNDNPNEINLWLFLRKYAVSLEIRLAS
ncbi:hypothetical protein DC345_30300 [Paenibacillus taichungensis]|uniref:Uncharacterized protein n=1 Tax=Paenibacillus taichungensis TaxID=484184 RepID=A0A329QBN9_9BACL|nr:hypothetical protein DC345_30300 [Paenibacillus taichungensis]